MSSKSLRKMFGLAVGTGLLLHVVMGQVAAEESCNCDDCDNLHSRITEVQAVMKEICKEAYENPTFYYKPYSPFTYNFFYLGRWQQAMNVAYRNNPNSTPAPTGGTDPFCNTTLNKGERNLCVGIGVQMHEDVHAATCRSVMNSNRSCHNDDDLGYLGCMTMGQYFKDDYNAYSTELEYEINQFQNLKGKKCCTSLEINTTIPPCNAPSFSMILRKLMDYLVG